MKERVTLSAQDMLEVWEEELARAKELQAKRGISVWSIPFLVKKVELWRARAEEENDATDS